MIDTLLKGVLKWLALGAGIYGVILLALYLLQERLIYFPWAPWGGAPDQIGLAYESLILETADGVQISGWFVPHPEARGTVLFLHGNAGNISHRLDTLALLHRLRVNTLIIDYRGYGQSQGRPSEAGTYQDAETAWRYLTETRGIPATEIIIFGRSLGGGVAAWLAVKHPPQALILESTFTSVADMAAKQYPFLPAQPLLRVRYETDKRLSQIEVPILIAHSPDDDLIPFEHGQQLFDLANEPKTFLKMEGTHADGFLRSMAVYERGLDDFLSRVLDK